MVSMTTTLRDFLQSLPAPFYRSKTKRIVATRDASRQLGYYRKSQDLAQATRVRQLLWAEAFVQTALYWETQGRLGYNQQTPAGVVSQQLRLRGEI